MAFQPEAFQVDIFAAFDHVGLHMSGDGGQRWQYVRSVYRGRAAYSDMALTPTGVAVAFERDHHRFISFTRLSFT